MSWTSYTVVVQYSIDTVVSLGTELSFYIHLVLSLAVIVIVPLCTLFLSCCTFLRAYRMRWAQASI